MAIHAITRRPRFAQLRRAGLAGVVAVLAGLALAPTAGAATGVRRPPGSPGPTWSITPTPNPPGATGDLRAVSCTAANACTAVGTSASFPHPVQALAERWNGTKWTIQPTNPAFSSSNTLFNGVSCTSATSCLAVGEVSGFAVSELWNGKTWNLTPALLKPGPAVFSTLNSVSCTSASNLHGRRLLERQREHPAHPGLPLERQLLGATGNSGPVRGDLRHPELCVVRVGDVLPGSRRQRQEPAV